MIIGQVSKQALALLFLFFGLTIAVIIKQLQKKYTFIPYTPTLFMVSVGLGYFAQDMGVIGDSIMSISQMDPRGILIIFLPPLIFQGGFNSDWYIFRKQSYQIFILAFPAVVISALTIMFSLKFVLNFDDTFFNYPEAFMFGSVLSCTDTVAVLALLKEAGAPKKFNSLIEGESLFNDGTCMVLLTISLELVKGGQMKAAEVVLSFLQLTVGAIALGIIFGMISIFLIGLVKKDSILTINITVGMCYILYFVSEYVNLGIKISGIMALVSIGLYMAAFGKVKFTAEAKQKTHQFWKVFVFIAQTIIFILGGVMVGTKCLNNPQLVSLIGGNEIIKLLLLYVCMTFARFFSIAVFMPKLQRQGYGLKWTQVAALTYGGLRGAVGIAFTLILASNQAVPVKCRIISLFLMSGCAFLTLLINGPTCGYVIKKIGLCVKSETKMKIFRKFVKQCINDLQRKIEDQLHANKHLQRANWDQVKEKSGINQLKAIVQQPINRDSIQLPSISKKNSLQLSLLGENRVSADQLDSSLMKQVRSRYLIALKGIFWQKFQKNQCTGISVKNLIECVDLDLDNVEEPLSSWQFLIGHVHNPYFFPICFWLRKFPIIKYFAFTLIYDRVMVIYDIVSTYLQGLTQCEDCCTSFPFQKNIVQALISQSAANRKLAQSYLDKQIKVAYPQIMKRIQTAKASHSIISYQKEIIEQGHRHGQIDQQFYKQLSAQIQKISNNIESDTGVKEQLSQIQTLMLNDFFMQMSKDQRKKLLQEKVEMVFQKDQPIIKNYEKQKYIYLITRGQISQEWKEQKNVIFKKNTKLYQISGISALWSYQNKREIQYTCTAESIVCLYSFPIQTVKDLINKNPKFQTILYKQMFPLLLKMNPKFKLDISAERWEDLRPFVTFRKILKDEQIDVLGQYVVLIEGAMDMEQQSVGSGFYDMSSRRAKIKGPAKVFYSSTQFQQNIHEKHTIAQLIIKGERNSKLLRQSSQKRSTLANDASGAFTRTLFARDDQ